MWIQHIRSGKQEQKKNDSIIPSHRLQVSYLRGKDLGIRQPVGQLLVQRQTEMFPKRTGHQGIALGHWCAQRKFQQDLYSDAAPLL